MIVASVIEGDGLPPEEQARANELKIRTVMRVRIAVFFKKIPTQNIGWFKILITLKYYPIPITLSSVKMVAGNPQAWT